MTRQQPLQHQDYSNYYKEKFLEGSQYQDFISQKFTEMGMPLVMYVSKRFQYDVGENTAGVEIKFDGKYHKTGNLYIETAEKSHPDNPDFIPSGIYRSDNAWLYVQGDYKTIFIFGKKHLIEISDKCHRVSNPTSQGFILSRTLARDLALKVIYEPGN